MKKAVDTSSKEKTLPAKKDEKPKKEYLELRIPRLRFRDTPINVYLVFSLVVFAFLLGMLTNKLIYLQNELKKVPAPTANEQAAEPTEPEPPQVVKVDNGKLPVLGENNAKVTIVEFSDLQCPFCKQYVDDTHKQLYDEYIKTGKVKLYFRHYPLFSIHPLAEKAAIASECANEQGKFWDYHDLLFASQDTWSAQEAAAASTSFVDYAAQLGIDSEQFRSCLDTDKYKKAVETDANAGNDVQVSGTPTFFINGYRMVGAQPFAELKKIIDQELSK